MESIKTALRKWVKAKDFKNQLSALRSLDQVKEVFKNLLPPELNNQLRLVKLDNGFIVVKTTQLISFNELKFYEKRIVAELGRRRVVVRGIENSD